MRALVLLMLLPPALASCARESEGPPTDVDACADGGAYLRIGVTDEACRTFVDEESRGGIVSDPYKAPSWSAPSPGATLSRSTPPLFSWSRGTLASAVPRWKKWLSFEGTAWAHGDTTGDIFVLTFRDPAGKELARVLTTELTYTPDAAKWASLGAPASLRVELVQLRLVQNALAAGTRPTAAAPATFSLTP